MTKKSDTKNKILDAAQHLMLKEGFHGVTVDRLIAEVGISKGSFFYHFRSKDELPAELLTRFFRCQGEKLKQAFALNSTDEAQNHLERVYNIIDTTGALFAETMNGQPGCVMAAFSYELMEQFPVLREISQSALAGWEASYAELFQPLLPDQHDSTSAAELAMMFMSILQGANIVARVANSSKTLHDSVKHFKLYLQHLR